MGRMLRAFQNNDTVTFPNYLNIGVRGSPERDILSLGAMGLGPGRFPALFA